MKLVLKIEDQQAGTLGSDVKLALRVATSCNDLDRALEILRERLSAKFWEMGRGGHHVWVKRKHYQGAYAVADIKEDQTTKVLISWNNEGGALETDTIEVNLDKDEYAIRNRIIEMLQNQIVNPGDTITVAEVA